ncbi:hypothetical protein GmHk_03G006561 [Glycine max]|nr:hypothetical protein GmHk_03G006561 [Glycine max]
MKLINGSFGYGVALKLTFETHLNKAMLQRSLSEPGFPRQVSQPRHVSVTPTITLLNHGKQRRCRVSGLSKVLKKLLRPILGRKSSGGERKHVPDPRNPLSWKTFSRSLRVFTTTIMAFYDTATTSVIRKTS